MSMSTAILLSCAMLGQANFTPAPVPAPQQPGAPGQAAPAAQPVGFRLLALQVTRDGGAATQSIDPQIQWYKDVLTQLPFDSYVQVTAGEAEAMPGEAVRMPIDANYDAYLAPVGPAPEGMQGLQLLVRITHSSAGGTVDAIRATCVAAPQKVLIFQGLEYDSGELLVIVGLNQDSESEDQQQNQEQQESEQNEEEQEPEEQEPEDQQDPQDPEENDEDPEQQPNESDEPKDREEIEALLDMLEATDKQLQNEEKDQRSVRDLGGAWW